MTDITLQWRPKDITTKPLLKAGYSQDQLDEVGKIFVHRYNGQNIDAGNKYSKMVRDSGSGHNVKAKPDNSKEIISTRNTDLENKSKDGVERAQEAKGQDGIMTQAEAIAFYDSNRR